MDLLDALDPAARSFGGRLHAAPDAAWANPTPCTEWTVRDLALHVVGGNQMSVVLLDGASAEESMAAIRQAVQRVTDVRAAFDESVAAQRAAFHRPGALDGVVHHVVGDIPARMLLGFRVADLLIHSWDLARGLGVDDTLDAEVLEVLWGFSAPMAEGMRASGRFGEGATGTLPDGAPLQHRVLDVYGRRP